MAKKKVVKKLKGEKFLFVLIVSLMILTPVSSVFSKAMLDKSNIELESMKKKIATQEKMNESLNMKINELASLDKIQEVATTLGLGYNNDNIKVVTE